MKTFFSLREIARRLTKSTIIGLTLGVVLAGYAVFAFQGPTQTPPGGNVPAPLNTGSSDQTKTGGLLQVFNLWVNGALSVAGGVKVGSFSSATRPACNADTVGTLIFDTTENKPHVCVSGGWKPLDSDFDKDGLVDWFDPNDSSFNPECIADNGGQCFIRPTAKSALDTDLVPENIKGSVNIFGTAGTYCPPPAVVKTCTSGDCSRSWVNKDVLTNACHIYCGGLTATMTCTEIRYISDAVNSWDWSTCRSPTCGYIQGNACGLNRFGSITCSCS